MFLEKDSHNKTQGWIEVVCGSMFSGKTEELIRRLNRARIAKLRVEIFKPGIDTRYSEEDVSILRFCLKTLSRTRLQSILAFYYENLFRETYTTYLIFL